MFIAFALLLSCTEDEVYTDSELVAQKIQSVIDQENVTHVLIARLNSNNSWFTVDSSTDFEIDGIFIRINDNVPSSYNLDKLFEYEIRRNFDDTLIELVLYFSI
ncbi:hypothetical protein [Marivirga sericea]|uniref:hypothetical protein n=1 Tax=Marivirga sericea TaxID=1028 RepID=UPI00111C6896|nr:hypothetical protein [Marivirga sericea]